MKKLAIVLGIALMLSTGALLVSSPMADASKWTKVSITTDKDNYFQGETVKITVKPLETDTGDTTQIDIVIYDHHSAEAKRFDNQTADNPTIVYWGVPDDAVPGIYDIEVFESGNPILKDLYTGYFTVHQSASIYPEIQLDKSLYFTGDVINIVVNVIVSGKTPVTGPFTCNYTFNFKSKPDETFENLGTTYTYYIPNDYKGDITIEVEVSDSSFEHQGFGSKTITVYYGVLLVNSNYQEYRGGEDVTVSYSLLTNRMTSPEYFYEITDSSSDLVATGERKPGTTQGGSFTYKIPSNPSLSYRFVVYAEQDDMQVSTGLVVQRLNEMMVKIQITSPSKYVTGTYAPGETLTIHYEIIVKGAVKMPSAFNIVYGFSYYGTLKSTETETTKTSGDVTYTIPSEVTNGNQPFVLSVTTLPSGLQSSAVDIVKVDANPSFFQQNVGGMSMMDLLLFVLLIIFFIITLVLFSFARKGRKPKPEPVLKQPRAVQDAPPQAMYPAPQPPPQPGYYEPQPVEQQQYQQQMPPPPQ